MEISFIVLGNKLYSLQKFGYYSSRESTEIMKNISGKCEKHIRRQMKPNSET
jgi:hypothetical protein